MVECLHRMDECLHRIDEYLYRMTEYLCRIAKSFCRMIEYLYRMAECFCRMTDNLLIKLQDFFCSHLVRAFSHLSVDHIALRYILKCYTRDHCMDTSFDRHDKIFLGLELYYQFSLSFKDHQ
jgi:hypothetical protein